MSRLNVGSFRHPDATADAITLTNGGDTQINRALGLGGATYGSSGQVLTSQGSGSAPQWATPAGGKVITWKSVTKTDTWSEGVSLGNVSSGITGLQLTHACSSTSSRLLLIASINTGCSVGTRMGMLYLANGSAITTYRADTDGNRQRRGATSDITANTWRLGQMFAQHMYHPNSTSSITYSIGLSHGNGGSATVYVNRSHDDENQAYQIRGASTFTILELENA